MEDKRPHWFYYILFSFHFAWQKFSHPRGTESRKMNGNDEVHSCEGQSNAYSIYLSMYNAATSWSSRAGVWPSLGQWKGLERVVFLRASMACLLSMKMTGESQYWRFLEEYNYRVQLCFITIVMEFDSGTLYISTLWKNNIYCILKLSNICNMLYILVQIFLGFFFFCLSKLCNLHPL